MTQQKRSKADTIQSGDLGFKKDEYIHEGQNKALREEFDYIIQKNAYSGQKIKGNYLIAYSLEYARKITFPGEGDPHYQDLSEENAHIGIAVHDATDFHFVSGLTVYVTVVDKNGFSIGSFEHPLLQRPNLYHYGRNWILPGDGKYTLRVKIETPENMLHNEKSELTYPTTVEVVFKNVIIKTGQKID
jgi:hypothetical protein